MGGDVFQHINHVVLNAPSTKIMYWSLQLNYVELIFWLIFCLCLNMTCVACSRTKNEFHWTSWQWWALLNALRAKKLCFCFWLFHWLSNIIAVPMEQSEIPKELFFSHSVDATLTIIMSSIKMVSIASTLFENKSSLGISDCSIGTAIMLDSQWSNQKQKQSFSPLRALSNAHHCHDVQWNLFFVPECIFRHVKN